MTKLHIAAIGPVQEMRSIHRSARDDSSSLLSIGPNQVAAFPGTQEVGTTDVAVAPLETYLSRHEVKSPALLKIDVQGFEYEVLQGSSSLLDYFDAIYCECSFVELYTGQKLAPVVVSYLAGKGFHLSGAYNASYDFAGRCIQADLLFVREST